MEIEIEIDLADMELIRSALRYYSNGVAYVSHWRDEFGLHHENTRRQKRQGRAGLLANCLDKAYPTTIDEDGTGISVKPL